MFVGYDTEVTSCLSTSLDENGFPVCQFDGRGEGADAPTGELHHPFGFASRPRDPDVDPSGEAIEGKACNLFVFTGGNEIHTFLGFDPRFIGLLPRLKKGGSMQYSAAGSFAIFDGEDGTQTVYVPIPNGDDPPTKAHASTMGVDGNGDPVISVVHCDGMAILLFKENVILKGKSGNTYIQVADDQIIVNGNVVFNGGATLGSPAGARPAAVAPELVTYLSGIEAILTTLAAAIDSKTPPSQGVSAGAVAAALVGLQGAKAAIPALNTSIA